MQYYINEQEQPQNDLQTKRNPNSLQEEVKDWSKSLFDQFFKPDELSPLITRGQSFLIQILAKSSSYFHRNITKHYKRTLIFLANYHKLMHIYSLKYRTPITNDMALHFIVLLGYSRLKDNKIDQAKNVFKNVWQYVHIKSCDKVIISIALNNLTFLHLNNHKPFKALQSSLKCIQIMGQNMGFLKKQNLRRQMVQDSVILINSLILCRKSLLKIISITQKSFYADLYRYINQIGYKCSKKYLGQQSDFTKVFSNYKNLGRLPVYFQAPEELSVERTTMEQKILKQLQGIYDVLKTKRQPEIVYVNQPQVVEQLPVKEPSVVKSQPKSVLQQSDVMIILPEQLQNQDEVQAGESISFNINGWTIQGHLLRPKNIAQKMSDSHQFFFGNLVLQYSKNRKQMKEIISTQRLQQIMALIDFESSLLYQYALKSMNDKEFFNFFLFPHIEIDEFGHLQFIIQKKPIINPFQTIFLSTNTLIFLNFISGHNLRIRISALDTQLNVHIQVQLRPSTFLKLFEVQQQLPELIHSVYDKIKELNYQKQIEIPELVKHQVTRVKVKNQKLLKKLMTNFLKDFQDFLLEVEQQEDGNYKFEDFLSNYEDQLDENVLLTFIEAKSNRKSGNSKPSQKVQQMSKIKGRFNICKYVSNIQSIEIFCQNNYSTFNIDSQSYAKGSIMIYGDKFESDFGVPLEFFQKNHMMKSILEIVAKRYELRTFFSPLKTHDEELYNQNAICQLPLICKSYRRAAVEDQNGYMVPVTISHLTVNNEVPLAFKVDVYFPCEGCAQYNILIKVQPSMWEKPVQKPAVQQVKQGQKGKYPQGEDKENSQVFSYEYGFKKDYFLIEWCQIEGYEQIMKLFSIKDMKILVKSSQSRFYSLERLFQDFK